MKKFMYKYTNSLNKKITRVFMRFKIHRVNYYSSKGIRDSFVAQRICGF